MMHRAPFVLLLLALLPAMTGAMTGAEPAPLGKYRQCLALMATSPDEARLWSERQLRSGSEPYAQHCHALALLKLGRPREAALDFDHVYVNIGTAAAMAGRLDVLAQSAEAWRLSGNIVTARARLDLLLRLADAADAEQAARVYSALLARSALATARGETMGALQDLDRAITLGNAPAAAYLARARLFVALHQPRLAAADARAALALSPGDAEAARLAGGGGK